MSGDRWLRKRVRVFAGFDRQKQRPPMVEGEVIGYIDGPSIIVRDANGNQQAWPVSLPIEEAADDDCCTYRDHVTGCVCPEHPVSALHPLGWAKD